MCRLCKVVAVAGGGRVINGATPSSFCLSTESFSFTGMSSFVVEGKGLANQFLLRTISGRRRIASLSKNFKFNILNVNNGE